MLPRPTNDPADTRLSHALAWQDYQDDRQRFSVPTAEECRESAKDQQARAAARAAISLTEEMVKRSPWYAVNGNTCRLARHLIRAGKLETAMEVVRFFEKPWHWERDYFEMIGGQKQ